MKQKLIVIGNGMAGIRFVELLLEHQPNKFDITIINHENELAYDRIQLSNVLSGQKQFTDTLIHQDDWYRHNGIELFNNFTVTEIRRANKSVKLSRVGSDATETLTYDYLVMATGSRPAPLPIPNSGHPDVLGFRSRHDVDQMLAASQTCNDAVVIGGGLLGLEAAYGLKKQGLNVTVVHLMDRLMERQLDPISAGILKKSIEGKGIDIKLSARSESFVIEGDKLKGLKLEDGTMINAQLAVIAIGIRPRTILAQEAGVDCNRGILVDDYMRTSDPFIYAVGECVEHREQLYGLVAPLYQMAETLAKSLGTSDNETSPYEGTVTSARLKVTGVDLFSAGQQEAGNDGEEVVLSDPHTNTYKKLIIKDNRLEGVILIKDVAEASWYFNLLKSGEDISPFRQDLIFGRSACSTAGETSASMLSLPDDMEICACNGVSKGDVVAAIKTQGLCTYDQVKVCTKASASCGGCADQVRNLVQECVGADSTEKEPEKVTICGCTNLSHDEARAHIREIGPRPLVEVFKALGWNNETGCRKCSPALNYYMIAEYPHDYQDQVNARHVNEKRHANIQKDGTYSVVPRMWGGTTTADELRAIADVVDKYQIPSLKVTGGQRIDLLGVKKEQLPHVWEDLGAAGMVSGHAYGKAVRTVKTCVGAEWCRFGVKDSMGFGVELEKLTWGSWTPHKVKMGVSACPRNCAEATIKDFGVIAAESGWEIHLGGNGGLHLRKADVFCKVADKEEAVEIILATLQYYRKTGHYLERTSHWVERLGLDSLKQIILEDREYRKHLHLEFLESLRGKQKDPWDLDHKEIKSFYPIHLDKAPTTISASELSVGASL